MERLLASDEPRLPAVALAAAFATLHYMEHPR